jgi:hypothetical protein
MVIHGKYDGYGMFDGSIRPKIHYTMNCFNRV